MNFKQESRGPKGKRRHPYGSVLGAGSPKRWERTDSAQDRPPNGGGRFAAWAAGVLASCLVAVIGFWINERGEDAFAGLRGKTPLSSVVTIKDQPGQIAFERGPLLREDFARLRLSNDWESVLDVVDSYNMARAKILYAQIVLIGNRNELTIIDIALRHHTRRAEVLTGGYVIGHGEGGISSEPIKVNLDLQEPFFAMRDKPQTRYFDSKSVALRRDETFVFEVEFTADTGYHEFDLEVIYLLEGEKRKAIISGPDGSPFKVTGLANDYRVYRGELYTFRQGGGERMSIELACAYFPKSKEC